ncbi:hypothetical protein VITU9109_06205, partial [Vibrio tubiashii ATCC 19109]
MPNSTSLWSKWRYRFKTMVRYRLMILTSAPIVLTLVALIGITIYWSIHYTWQSALVDVSERLGVAENSIELIQEKQANHVKSFASSFEFVSRVRSKEVSELDLSSWVSRQREKYKLDFLRFHRVDSMENKFRFMDLTHRESFFDVLTQQELAELGNDLVKRAQTPILENNSVESRGLVSRTVIPIRSQTNDIIGFLDGGLLLNNSTVLVDTIRDLIYPSKQD